METETNGDLRLQTWSDAHSAALAIKALLSSDRGRTGGRASEHSVAVGVLGRIPPSLRLETPHGIAPNGQLLDSPIFVKGKEVKVIAKGAKVFMKWQGPFLESQRVTVFSDSGEPIPVNPNQAKLDLMHQIISSVYPEETQEDQSIIVTV